MIQARSEGYGKLKKKLAPSLRFNQELYEAVVADHVSPDTVWLDAGCGRHILPQGYEGAEHQIVSRAKLAVGCDTDQLSIGKHISLNRVVVADLEHLPFRAGSFNLVTCNMVLEHLHRPLAVFAEFARVSRERGLLIVHTPNAYSHNVIGARLVSRSMKLRLAEALDGRAADEVFPAYYRANTARRLRTLMAQVGLKEEKLRMVASDGTLALAHPILAALELLYVRLTMLRAFKLLRTSILGSFVKPAGRRLDEYSTND
jgi:SAM-dependent methyltransferase